MASTRRTRSVVPLVTLVVVVGLGLAALGAGGSGAPTSPSPSAAPPEAGPTATSAPGPVVPTRPADDPMAMGDPDAPVRMVEWADFQCPFCGRFARDTRPELLERYVEEGVLRIEWRDFPYLGPASEVAARAGRAAARQDAFWKFHDLVYAEPREPNSGELDRQFFLDAAEQLSLDVERFAADMDSSEVAAAVQADVATGQQLGITGTPAFLVNGQPIMGAQPTETFVQAIESAADGATS